MRKSLWIVLCVLVASAVTACSIDQAAASGAPDGVPAAIAASANNGTANQPADPAQVNPQAQNPAGAPDQNGTGGQGQNPAGAQGQNPGATQSPEEATALKEFSQVAVGILYIQDNQTNALTKDQAAKLLTTYQGIQTSLQAAHDAVRDGTPMPGGPNGAPPAGGPDGAPPADGTSQAGGPGGNGGGPGGDHDGPGGHGTVVMLRGIDVATIQGYTSSIRAVLTADQLATIDALTEEQIQATLQQHDIGMGHGGGPAGPGQNPPATPDPSQLATKQAQGGLHGPRGGNSLIDAVIAVLETAAAG